MMKTSLRRACVRLVNSSKVRNEPSVKLRRPKEIIREKLSLSPETFITSSTKKRKREVGITAAPRHKHVKDAVPVVGIPQVDSPKNLTSPSSEDKERSCANLRQEAEPTNSTPNSQSGSIADAIFSPQFHAIKAAHGSSLEGEDLNAQGERQSLSVCDTGEAEAQGACAQQIIGQTLAPCSMREDPAELSEAASLSNTVDVTEDAPDESVRLSSIGFSLEGQNRASASQGEMASIEVIEESVGSPSDDKRETSVQIPMQAHADESGQAEYDEEFDDFNPFLFIKRLPRLSDVVSPNRPQLLPKQTRRCPPVTLVLDLDETLVHSTLEPCLDADFTFPVYFNNQVHTVHVRRRPYLEEFMERVAQLFEIIVFTASQSVYAEQLLNILDPQRRLIRHRVFRDSCVYVEGNYLKDLTILGRDMTKVVIVDNSPQAFGFQVENGIPIESWFDDKTDTALQSLLPFLESLADVEDVRPLIASRFNLKERIANASECGSHSARRSMSNETESSVK